MPLEKGAFDKYIKGHKRCVDCKHLTHKAPLPLGRGKCALKVRHDVWGIDWACEKIEETIDG